MHQLIDKADNIPTLERLLDSAEHILANQESALATLVALTDDQRQQLEKAIQEHEAGKTVSHEEMKQRHRAWLNR